MQLQNNITLSCIYGYRFYSPTLGRWVNRDPIGELGATTLNKNADSKKVKAIEAYISYVRRINPQAGDRIESRLQARLLQLRQKQDINTFLFSANEPISRCDILGLACGSGCTDKIVPDKPAGFDFTGCCEGHDDCYGDCNTKPSKSSCDDAFHDCMLEKCISDYNAQQGCVDLADIYYGAVVNKGQDPFDDARKCCK